MRESRVGRRRGAAVAFSKKKAGAATAGPAFLAGRAFAYAAAAWAFLLA